MSLENLDPYTHEAPRINMSKFLKLRHVLQFITILFIISGRASASNIRIGVPQIRGPEDAIKYWTQIADHLNEQKMVD